eukprot:3701135-Pyramimonas_sp.AAC.1
MQCASTGALYSEKDIDDDAATAHLERWFAPASRRGDFAFSEEDLIRAARHGLDPYPGPDRLPHAAWARTPAAVA